MKLKPLPRPPFKYIFTDPKDVNAGLPTQQLLEYLDSLSMGLGKAFPWVDIRDFGAVGDGVTNDQPAIQNAINFANANFGGGLVLLPNIGSNNYAIGAPGLTVKGHTTLVGLGMSQTALSAIGDVATVTFDTTAGYGGARMLTIFGFQNAAATKDACTINTLGGTIIRDCIMQFGRYGLNVNTSGGQADGVIDNCNIYGYTGCVLSNSGMWYNRCKFDDPLVGSTYAFHQVAGSGVNENAFILCDFSGQATNSLYIDDPNSVAGFSGKCAFGNNIQVVRSSFLTIGNCEFSGSTVFTISSTGGNVIVTGSFPTSSSITISVTAPATKTLAGNVNIT